MQLGYDVNLTYKTDLCYAMPTNEYKPVSNQDLYQPAFLCYEHVQCIEPTLLFTSIFKLNLIVQR